jgi:serine/threonine-protein kinase
VSSSAPFGRYVLKERLAQGGMGEVFRAVAVGEHGFEKPVVVKRVLPAHAGREDFADLFVAEAKLMTRLAHPNIVEVYDFGRGDHHDYYLVLELVDGVDLGRLMRAHAGRREKLPEPIALFVAAQVLRGLHHAHTRLADEGVVIVHRDVSPSNVLLSTEGEVKVADFGVALMQRGPESTAGVAGKPGYMAPEQREGRAVDARADVYAVGVVLHQMLSGKLPEGGEPTSAGEAVDALVRRALAGDPADRFPTARAMAQAIEALRDRGQRLASADDLADAVRAAQKALPAAGRRVIALGSAAPGEEEEEPRELTRAGGGFTLRLPVRADATTRRAEAGEGAESSRTLDRFAAPEPRTERISAVERPAPVEPPIPAGVPDAGRVRALRRAGLAAVAIVAVGGAVALSRRGPEPRAPRVAASSAPPSSSAPPPSSEEAPAAPASAPAPTATASARALPPRVVPRASAAPAALSAAPSAPPPVDDGCTGKVKFRTEDSWEVAGGPSPTQTPAVVEWRCGTYALTARYRPDPTITRSATVQVRAGQMAEVSFRPR